VGKVNQINLDVEHCLNSAQQIEDDIMNARKMSAAKIFGFW
jgi:hypothetical protein